MTDGDAGSPDPTGGVHLRSLRTRDAEAVGRLTLDAYDAYGRLTGPYRHRIADPLARREGCTDLLVAEIDVEVVGTVTFVLPTDDEWEGRPQRVGDAGMRMLAVSPEAEGRGVGRALVTACIERARVLGCRRLVVTSMAWMTRAHHLYERLGFVHRPDLDVRFPSGLGRCLTLDLTDDAAAHFPPPGPVPDEPPDALEIWHHRRPAGGAAPPGGA